MSCFGGIFVFLVLAGHLSSYGFTFPVPEKRRKRLYQEYAEIEKNIKKQR
jgi:photosystem II Psb27 protein